MIEQTARIWKRHVKFFTSTKATLLEERVNKEIAKLEEDGYEILSVMSNISFSGKEGYMIICQIEYIEEVMRNDDISLDHQYDTGIDFGAGMSFDCPSSEIPEA